jgi:hypothetical protein
MTRSEMVAYAESLVLDAEECRDRVEESQPCRLPTARFILDETVRIVVLLQSSAWNKRTMTEVCARLVRADLMARALQEPLQ